MIYLNTFDSHASYEEKLNGGGVDFKIPNVSYCKDVKDVHFNPYNLIKFYVGNITGTTQQTVKIYTDIRNYVDVQVSEGNKWYTYVLPKNKGLFKIEGDSVKKVVVKADMSYKTNINSPIVIIPSSTVEASFKGSNTNNVTSMNNMFSACSGLTSLDLSRFDTSNVTNMSNMFEGCSGLTSLDVSSFDTSNVKDMNSMFYLCSKLTSLDVSNFNTSKVTNMDYMFGSCNGLTSLILSNFNTSMVTHMSYMFYDCSNLTTLDLSGWDLSKIIEMYNVFEDCSNLGTIIMKGCSEYTINKVKSVKPSSARIVTE